MSTKEHANVDSLSRLPLPNQVKLSSTPAVFNLTQISVIPFTSTQIATATKRDLILSKVNHFTKNGWPSTVSDVLKPYISKQHEITVEGGCLLWGIRVIVATATRVARSSPSASRSLSYEDKSN